MKENITKQIAPDYTARNAFRDPGEPVNEGNVHGIWVWGGKVSAPNYEMAREEVSATMRRIFGHEEAASSSYETEEILNGGNTDEERMAWLEAREVKS